MVTQANKEIAQLINFYDKGFNSNANGFAPGARDVTLTARGLSLPNDAKLFLSGNLEKLGQDNYALALEMKKGAADTWSVDLSLPPGSQFSFELFAQTKERHNYAESSSRTFTVPYAGGKAIVDVAFDKRLDQ